MEQTNKPKSTLERIEFLETRVGNLSRNLSDILRRTLANEQSCIALGKTLNAITEELLDKKMIDSASIFGKMRDFDDRTEKEKIAKVLASKMIEPTDVVQSDSLVIISQKETVTKKTGEVLDHTITNYKVVQMGAAYTPKEISSVLVDKKVNDVIVVDKGGNDDHESVLTATVLEIYKFVNVQQPGE
jgi:DNA-binding transcriptional regulator LsrR (DeoR family)